MSTLNNIFNKITDKTELAKHEVELGAIDIYIQAYKNEAAKIVSVKSKIISANDELGMLLGSLETLPEVGNKLIAQMKDLGINQELKNVESVNNAIKGLVKSLNPIYKTISNESKKI